MPTLFRKHIELRTFLGIVSGSVICIILVLYVLFQARFLIAGPSIELSDEPALVDTSTIRIEGQTRNHTSLTLNGNSIFTDEQGNFNELLVRHGSYTIMTLRARDRYDREVTLERIFTHLPQS